MRFVAVMVLLSGCGSSPDAASDGAPPDLANGGAVTDGGPGGSDGGVPAPVDSGSIANFDLASADLTGLTNCFGATVCDPTSSFCIRYYNGSQATPGSLAGGPACYQPSDTCANQGLNMDCTCIQGDSNLGAACAGSCVDHMDGTYDCYAM
jgi:hypothetical protein